MYKVVYNENIFVFARENKIVISDILKDLKEKIEKFPYMYPYYNSNGVSNKNIRIVKIPNKNLKIIYIVFENKKTIVIEDIVYSNSSVKLKI